MAIGMFLKLGDIEGDSQDDRHHGEIDVTAWSWGLTRAETMHAGPGGGAGKVSVQDLSLTKYVDRSTPALILACCTGKHFAEALLTVRKGGDRPLEYLKIAMKDVLVSSTITGNASEGGLATETVILHFAEFRLEYTPQKSDGSAAAVITAAWNIARNRVP